MSVQISYKKQTLFGLMFILLIFFIAEISIQSYNYFSPSCKFTDSDVFANVEEEIKRKICLDNDNIKFEQNPLRNTENQKLNLLNINSHGFRGNEIDLIKPDNTYRIFVVGGSTVLGNSATSDKSTIPGQLENLLNNLNLDIDIEVINAGIGGAFSFTEINLIKNKIMNYSPDVLIVYNGWNDIDRDLSVMNEDSSDYNLQTIILRQLIIKNDFIKSPGLALKIYNNYKFSITETRYFDENGIDEKAELWKTRWMDICELGSKNNFDVVIMLQPLVGTGEKILTLEEEIYYKKYDHANLIPNYEKYGQKLDEMRETCTKVVDLRSAFDDQNDTIFHDSGHVGDKGNKIIAEKIYEKILPIINQDINKLNS